MGIIYSQVGNKQYLVDKNSKKQGVILISELRIVTL